MSRSLTVRIPAARSVLAAAAVIIVAAVLIVGGIRVGWSLVSGGPVGELSNGVALQEIHLVNGTVYVGRLVGEQDGYLKLDDPAVVRQLAAASGSSESQLIVQALFTDPFSVDGRALIPRGQVILVANVVADSGLARAYDEALHGTGQPLPTSGPTAPPTSPPG